MSPLIGCSPRSAKSAAATAGGATTGLQRRAEAVRGTHLRPADTRVFKGWEEHHDPGWLELDLVARCGGCMEVRFLWTLVSTDIATGWSEGLHLLQRAGSAVLMALPQIRRQLAFPLREIDAENDPVYGLRPTEFT